MAQPPLGASGSADEPAGAADDLLSEESEGLADESGSELRSTQIGAGQHAARLDKALADLVPEFSRSYLQQLLVQGLVSLNGKPIQGMSELRAKVGTLGIDKSVKLGILREDKQVSIDVTLSAEGSFEPTSVPIQ